MSNLHQNAKRIAAACDAMRAGLPVVLLDDDDRENEADLIAAAETLSHDVMARLIRDCSGIVCLCLDDRLVRQLDLPPMAAKNETRYGTAFTVSIEARVGVTTGVSAADRLTTVRAAIADGAKPEHLARPGHVFPLRAQPGGVLSRRGHTEGAVDLARLAGPQAGRGAVRADGPPGRDAARQARQGLCQAQRLPGADHRGNRGAFGRAGYRGVVSQSPPPTRGRVGRGKPRFGGNQSSLASPTPTLPQLGGGGFFCYGRVKRATEARHGDERWRGAGGWAGFAAGTARRARKCSSRISSACTATPSARRNATR